MPTLTSRHSSKAPMRPTHDSSNVNMKEVASVILAGGEGSRLYPLTLSRCKPAVSFGGKYRLIDVPISNSIHSECQKIYILTQFLSSSLHHHLFQTYLQGGKSSELIEILTAEQKPSHQHWFLGTADAVRQNIQYLLESSVEYFLILSGDQLYHLDFRAMVSFAKKTDADLVIAALPVGERDAGRMGILSVNEDDFVVDFHEKPQDKTLLNTLKSRSSVLERANAGSTSKRPYLGSMGIYLFKRQALIDLLASDLREDFGKHLIPTQVKKGKTAAFFYDGYWEDIGTIETFYHANINLTTENPPFDFYHPARPIFSHRYDLPPAKISNASIKEAILCEGSVVDADEVTSSLIGPRTHIQKGTIIRNSYLMGNDYFSEKHRSPVTPSIGQNCIIKGAIIDKNVSIGHGVHLTNKNKITQYNSDNLFVRDGIIIVPRGATLPDGFIF